MNSVPRGLLAAGLVLASCAWAGRAAAQDPQNRPRASTAAQPLSAEDLALVKDLALLENVELLRNLELFEPGTSQGAQSVEPRPVPPAPPQPRQ